MVYLEAFNKDRTDAEQSKNRPVGFGVIHCSRDLDTGVFYVERRKLGKFEETGEVIYEEYFYNEVSKRIEKNVLTVEQWNDIIQHYMFDDKWYPIVNGVYENNRSGRHLVSKDIDALYHTMMTLL